MNMWNWFRPKPINYIEIFGELSGESAKSFYESYFKNSGYKTIEVSLPEEIRRSIGYEFDIIETFDFPDRPIKQPDHWILGSHIELDTPTIIVDRDKKIMFEDGGLEYIVGKSDRIYLAENFISFLEYIVTRAE